MTRRITRQYVNTAIDSLTLAVELFNRPSPAGRDHATVMLTAHAFEMLLKAAMHETRRPITFKGSERSFDLGKCISVAETELQTIDASDRTLLVAIKNDRDAATHQIISISEDVLWIHLRSAITIFRKVLNGLTGQDLIDVMPGRVLPVSAHPPTDVGLVIDKEMEQIASMLGTNKRRGPEVRARLLPLVSLDRAARGVADEVSGTDVEEVVSALKAGADWTALLPGITGLDLVGGPRPSDEVQEITLRLDPKHGDLAVRPARPDEDAAAYREIDTFDKYSIKLSEFGPKLGLNSYEGYAIVYELELKDDPNCYKKKLTKNRNPAFQGLSNVALERAKARLQDGSVTVEGAVANYKRLRRGG